MCAPEVYWIWLQQALDIACKRNADILEFFTSAKTFYEEGMEGWRNLGFFTMNQLRALDSTKLEDAQKIYDDAIELGYSPITPEQERYPHALRQIVDPPAVLYCKGRFPNFDEHVAIAVVGTRTASPYGIKVSFDISAELCRAGVMIVSGGALGVDISAHKGALSVDGITVVVLGCGINYPYLMENADIRSAIAMKGAVITEYPPSTPPLPHHFPVRNRIISALSQGTLVVEAAKRSGSLITASLALEQGKDIFAIPGDIGSRTSRGTNELIKSGAKAVVSAEDILEEYRQVYPGRISSVAASSQMETPGRGSGQVQDTPVKKTKKPLFEAGHKKIQEPKPPQIVPTELSADTRTFYEVLTDQPQHLDDLTEAAGLTPRQALCAITELELLGCLRSKSGKRYYIEP